MAVVGVIGAVILWAIISKIMEWREDRKEEERRQYEVQMAQDAAARQTNYVALEKVKRLWKKRKGHVTCSWIS